MSKDPAFLFYTQDFVTGTMFMTNEEVGVYVRLLCAQHQHGGIIPAPSFNRMSDQFPSVKEKFIETEDGFFNERLMKEITLRAKKSTNLSANACKRWEMHKQKKSQSNAIASALQMPSEDENENENISSLKRESAERGNESATPLPDSKPDNKQNITKKASRQKRNYRPTEEEIIKYAESIGFFSIDVNDFWYYYDEGKGAQKGWEGDWEGKIRTWKNTAIKYGKDISRKPQSRMTHEERLAAIRLELNIKD